MFELLQLLENDTLYWTDMGSSKISRSSRDQTSREDIITSGLGRVEGLAVDWIAGAFFVFLSIKFFFSK